MVRETTPTQHGTAREHEYQQLGIPGHHLGGYLPVGRDTKKMENKMMALKRKKKKAASKDVAEDVWPQRTWYYLFSEVDTLSHPLSHCRNPARQVGLIYGEAENAPSEQDILQRMDSSATSLSCPTRVISPLLRG